MICLNCKESFYIKRTFLKLFDLKKYYICDKCYKNYPLNLKIITLPLESYELKVLSLFENIRFEVDAYIDEISYIFEYLYKRHKNYFLVFINSTKLSITDIEILNFLSECEKKSILLVCLELKK